MSKISEAERVHLEHSWANRAIKDNGSPVDRGLWSNFRYSSRTHTHEKKRYVAWHLVDGKVEILDVLRLECASLSLDYGIGLTLSRRDGTRHAVTSTPSRPQGLDVFFWVPAFNDVRWLPTTFADAGSERLLRVAMNFKQARGCKPAVEGTHYVEEFAEFMKHHPEHETTNF